jgi:hypothetical protein
MKIMLDCSQWSFAPMVKQVLEGTSQGVTALHTLEAVKKMHKDLYTMKFNLD